MLQSPLKGESAGLETRDAKGTLLDLCTGCIDQEQDVISAFIAAPTVGASMSF